MVSYGRAAASGRLPAPVQPALRHATGGWLRPWRAA